MSHISPIHLLKCELYKTHSVFLAEYCSQQKINPHYLLGERFHLPETLFLFMIDTTVVSSITRKCIQCRQPASINDTIPIALYLLTLSNTSYVTAVSYLKA